MIRLKIATKIFPVSENTITSEGQIIEIFFESFNLKPNYDHCKVMKVQWLLLYLRIHACMFGTLKI